ncbi:MAG: hypothetical protein A3I05_08875 [Deltaproteobacteria bacterium RIFCSPLOWO2_02_FULL_44_10]|nr:MAG: hypothetical protein A3C46_08740 [Deltaproteobacteria bacterium RIFCSPHIGHO2_02_FULL_44_16]OGQ45220.1 MAG: hypothetical protein A3I05_08875 [Deltaproteobacteria bacterium RIFCSPLOWO2_02_FULL_44_10]
MSLNQKYSWAHFLKEHPEMKKKGVKRTSDEGKKAFETAFKKYAKEFLKARLHGIETLQKKATHKREELIKKQQEVVKAKKRPRVKFLQTKIGRQDAWLSRLSKQAERAKELQKNF